MRPAKSHVVPPRSADATAELAVRGHLLQPHPHLEVIGHWLSGLGRVQPHRTIVGKQVNSGNTGPGLQRPFAPDNLPPGHGRPRDRPRPGPPPTAAGEHLGETTLHRIHLLALLAIAAFSPSAVAQSFEITNTIPISGATGLPNGTWGWSVTGVSASGLVVGSIETQTGPRSPYTWTSTGATALALPAGHIGGSANGVNAQGWVVGTSYSEFGRGTITVWQTPSSPMTIAVPGEIDSEGFAIGNGGHVAGITGLDRPGPVQGLIWNNGSLTHWQSPAAAPDSPTPGRSMPADSRSVTASALIQAR